MTAPQRVIPRRAVVSWILYDLANVIFSMGVISLYFSLFVSAEVGSERADSLLGRISALSMGIMFCLSPLLGAMTDRARRRMPFLVWATLICCACTALIARGPFFLSAILFIVANGAYQAGVQFYDSLLPEVTTEQNRGRINGIAVGLGYTGSYIAVGAGLWMSTRQQAFPFADYFLFVAIAFLAIAFPCFVFVGEKGNPNPRPIFTWTAVSESLSQTIHTLKSGNKYPGLLRFLVGRDQHRHPLHVAVHEERREIHGTLGWERRAQGAARVDVGDHRRDLRRGDLGFRRRSHRTEADAQHRALRMGRDVHARRVRRFSAPAHRLALRRRVHGGHLPRRHVGVGPSADAAAHTARSRGRVLRSLRHGRALLRRDGPAPLDR